MKIYSKKSMDSPGNQQLAFSTQQHASSLQHFQRLQRMAEFRVIGYLLRFENSSEDLSALFGRFPFLLETYDEFRKLLPGEMTWEAAFQFLRAELATFEARTNAFLPLRALQAQAQLSHTAILALMLVGAVEDHQNFGALFQQLQPSSSSRRPSLELLAQILAEGEVLPAACLRQALRGLLSSGLVEVLNPAAPRAEWQLRVPPSIWDLLHGDGVPQLPEHLVWHDRDHFPNLDELKLRPEERARLQRIPALLANQHAHTLIIRAMRGSERLQVAGAMAHALGCHLISTECGFPAQDERWRLLGPVCTLTQAVPVFMLDLAPGETYELPSLNSYTGAVLIVLGLSGGVRGKAVERAVSWTMSELGPAERREHWAAAFAEHEVIDLPKIAERFLLPGEYIRQAAAGAINQAHLENDSCVRLPHIRQAAQTLNRQQLETLAQRLDAAGNWSHLVVSANTSVALRELERRCRFREALLARLGPAFSGNLNRGVRALFNGASGTGKTLAAKILAAELSLDLYRVDLSAVVNKYIGETEKNLHQIFTRAEELDVILLLDEGDALLTNRTQVKSSNDRYANLETNYLLQRLESYTGILIVTSNASENIDKAFQRRIDVSIEFHLPAAEERLQIWRLHLPADHAVPEACLENAAIRCSLSGGQIRNAVLYAASIALDESAATIGERHIELAIANEYRKAGSVSPLKTAEVAMSPANGRIERMLTAMR